MQPLRMRARPGLQEVRLHTPKHIASLLTMLALGLGWVVIGQHETEAAQRRTLNTPTKQIRALLERTIAKTATAGEPIRAGLTVIHGRYVLRFTSAKDFVVTRTHRVCVGQPANEQGQTTWSGSVDAVEGGDMPNPTDRTYAMLWKPEVNIHRWSSRSGKFVNTTVARFPEAGSRALRIGKPFAGRTLTEPEAREHALLSLFRVE